MKSALEVADLKMERCTGWDEIVQVFDSFPSPTIEIDDFGDFGEKAWIFRGHGSMECLRVPSVERAAEKKSVSWVVLESMLLEEFRKKAPMHVEARNLPPSDERLAWLALMQHYGAPTRLLDFTYSPYVALYFAIRSFRERAGTPVYVFAVNARELANVAEKKSQEADRKERDYEAKNKTSTRPKRVSVDPTFASTDSDVWQFEREYRRKMLLNALSPSKIRRQCYNRQGFAAIAAPTMQNPRLSSQQGVFLLNGAEGHSLRASLFTMMSTCKGPWYRCFEIPPDALPSIERKLFQMNIHELSLFPDMEGLARFLRQKARLH